VIFFLLVLDEHVSENVLFEKERWRVCEIL